MRELKRCLCLFYVAGTLVLCDRQILSCAHKKRLGVLHRNLLRESLVFKFACIELNQKVALLDLFPLVNDPQNCRLTGDRILDHGSVLSLNGSGLGKADQKGTAPHNGREVSLVHDGLLRLPSSMGNKKGRRHEHGEARNPQFSMFGFVRRFSHEFELLGVLLEGAHLLSVLRRGTSGRTLVQIRCQRLAACRHRVAYATRRGGILRWHP